MELELIRRCFENGSNGSLFCGDTFICHTIACKLIEQPSGTFFSPRWGQVVFETTELNRAWDGSVAGIAQEANVFVWMCAYQFEGEEKKTERGTAMLVR